MTRDLAHDAAHPLDPAVAPGAPCQLGVELAALPVATVLPSSGLGKTPRCEFSDGPLLELRDGSGLIDGVAFAPGEELHEVFAEKAELWRQINADTRLPNVLFAVPETRPASDAFPWLEVVRRAGYDRVASYSRAPLSAIASRTLGEIRRQRCCSIEWDVVPDLGMLRAAGSWQRLAHQIEARQAGGE
jgi:hypothetical protein